MISFSHLTGEIKEEKDGNHRIEKIFRDARASMIEDGVNETLALLGASRL
jgi:alkylation response protein AidB-like acyl-CoA dehydrogenase